MSDLEAVEVIHATPDQARALTDRIRVGLEATWQLIVEAWEVRAWASLGYSSWDDYCRREFGNQRLQLPREERTEQIQSMREAGMSIRAIASATGHSVNTVQKDMTQVYQSDTPAVDDAEIVDEPVKITGTDGKTYTPRLTPNTPLRDIPETVEPTRADPRPPLPKVMEKTVYDIHRLSESLIRQTKDDRFKRNRERLALVKKSWIKQTIHNLEAVLEALDGAEEGSE